MSLKTDDIKSSFNYPSMGKVKVLGTDYSTMNYPPEDDSTSSGGSGSFQDAWSTAAQRGSHLYTPSPRSSAFPTYNGTSLYSTPSTPVSLAFIPVDSGRKQQTPAGAAPDSWESRGEAMDMLASRYRDSIGGIRG